MDPGSAHTRIMELAARLVQGDPKNLEWSRLLSDAQELSETFLALDEWLCRQGFLPEPWQTSRREERLGQLERACRSLMRDEVLERQGEEWWDETVTSGLHHRQQAEKLIGSK